MSAQVQWNGEKFLARFGNACNQGVTAAAAVLQSAMVENVIRVQTGERRVSGTTRHVSPSGRVSFKYRDGLDAFKGRSTSVQSPFGVRQITPGRAYYVGPGAPPGSFPGRRSGRFSQSIGFAPGQNLVAYAGSGAGGGSGAVPYAMRLEFGYFGTDSLGRTYHQPARPWAMRSARLAAPRMFEAFREVVAKRGFSAIASATGGGP